jgi:tetratricopeptide (TPR) repeat protein
VAVLELLQLIREAEPPKPSTRLSTTEELPSVAANRGLEPRKLNGLVRGELDWIVMKALEKDRTRRYETVGALAADVRRFLAEEPVEARRPSAWYRFRKFARRNKAALTTASVVAFAVLLAVVGLAVSTVLVWRQSEMTRAAKIEADDNLDTAFRLLNDFYLDMAERRLPQQQALALEDRQLLEKALQAYEQFARQRGTERRVRQQAALAYLRLGNIQNLLGQDAQAKENYLQARELFRGLAASFPNDSECRYNFARCLSAMADFAHPRYFDTIHENEEALLHALDLQKGLANEFPDNANYQRELGQSYARMGFRFFQTGRLNEAENLLRCGLAVRDKLVEDHPTADSRQELGDGLGRLGCVLLEAGKLEEAEKLFRQALALRKKIVDDFPSLRIHRSYLAFSYRELGLLLQRTGRLQEAEENHRQSVALWRSVVDEFSGVPVYRRVYSTCLNDLADVLLQMRRFEEGEQAYRESQTVLMEVSRDYPAVALNEMGWGAFRPLPGGEPQRIALNSFLLAMNPFNWETYVERGQTYERLWESQKAIADYSMALALLTPGHKNYGEVLFWRSNSYRRIHDLTKAEADLQKIAELDLEVDVIITRQQPVAASQCNNLALRYLGGPEKHRDPNKALPLAQKAVKFVPDNCLCLNTLGVVLYWLGRYSQAMEKLERSLRDSKGETAAINLFFLAMCHARLGDTAKAKDCYERAVHLLEEQQDKLHPCWRNELDTFRAEAREVLQTQSRTTTND